MRTITVTISLMVLLVVSAAAEIVYLKDGIVIKGSIVTITNSMLTLRTEGGELNINRNNVQRIDYTDSPVSPTNAATGKGTTHDEFPQKSREDVGNKFYLQPWVGYTTVDMKDFNTYVRDYINRWKTYGPEYSGRVTQEAKNGMIYGLDIGYNVTKVFSIGPRVAYLMVNQAQQNYAYEHHSPTPSWEHLDYYETKYDLSLIPVMFGGQFKTPVNKKCSFMGSMYLGYGFANMRVNWTKQEKDGTNPFVTTEKEYHLEGSGVVVDCAVGGEYAISKRIFFGLNVGYRFARVAKMEFANDVDGIKKGTVFTSYWDGKDIVLDFSGLTLNAGLSFKF